MITRRPVGRAGIAAILGSALAAAALAAPAAVAAHSLNVTYQSRLPLAVSSELADIRMLMERLGIGRTFDVSDPVDVARTLVAMLEPEPYAELKRNVMTAAEELCWERESRRYVELFADSVRAAGSREQERSGSPVP